MPIVPNLSHEDRETSITDIARALAVRTPSSAERDEPFGEAAVALVLYHGDHGLEALFIKRATREGDPWSGQIALPGGRRGAGEDSLVLTAVRETFEEIGLDLAAHGELLGELDELRPRNPGLPPIIVRPYVFAIRERPALVHNDEVADSFWAPLREVFDPARRKEITIHFSSAHLRRQAIGYGDHDIWGMTESILRTFEGLCR